MSDPPLGFGFKAMTDFWGQAGKAALQAQDGAAQTFGEFFKTIPAMMATGSAIPFAADSTEPVQAIRQGRPHHSAGNQSGSRCQNHRRQ